ncbi:MAG: S1 RNA-binding domain-containing protein [Myxococcaceae bacterium]
MLGIPAGRGGEREERGGRGGRGGDKPRGPGGDRGRPGGGDRGPRQEHRADKPAEAKPAEQAAAPVEGEKKERHEARGGHGGRDRDRSRDRGGDRGQKKPEPKKQMGPLVVVRRASGTVETRALDAEGSSLAPEVQAAEGAPAEAAAEVTPAPAAEAQAAATEEGMPEASAPVAPTPAPTPRPSVSEDVPESQSFAEMYEHSAKESAVGRRHLKVGEKVSGKIFQLGKDVAFVSLDGIKSEAMIDLRELLDAEGILRLGVGDVVEAHVIEAGAKGVTLSKQLTKGTASMAMLAEARASGMPVEGLVLSVNKGGLEVAVGDVRAFCPASQVDVRFVENLDQFIGEKWKFRVTEVREKKVVLSRRALLEEEQKVLAAETRKSLAAGAVLKGKVTGVRDFGAFVDLGGLEGMIPVSEMSHTRIGHPSEVLKVGDEVEVEVLRMEAANPSSPDKAKHKERITLSIRSRMEDPWKLALAEIKEGEQLKGKIVRLQPFGAFVELRPGVDGLIHVSALSDRRIAHPRDVVQVGQEVTVQVEKLDPDEKRIGLRLVGENGVVAGQGVATSEKPAQGEPGQPREPAPKPRVGQVVTGKIDRIEQYGVFVAFPGGKGLVPASETGTERGTDMKRTYTLGQELKVQVLEIDATGKIRLSVTAAQRSEERADIEAWKSTQPKGTGKQGFGTFADLLKGKKV